MSKKETVKYWIESAKEDWKVSQHLYDKKDYAYDLTPKNCARDN